MPLYFLSPPSRPGQTPWRRVEPKQRPCLRPHPGETRSMLSLCSVIFLRCLYYTAEVCFCFCFLIFFIVFTMKEFWILVKMFSLPCQIDSRARHVSMACYVDSFPLLNRSCPLGTVPLGHSTLLGLLCWNFLEDFWHLFIRKGCWSVVSSFSSGLALRPADTLSLL